ncbi:MAG TPA: choice-of-anchor tandem repeat GloVer-containing protein [Candidatus Sulfotelmatobacter sp.]|nr:choice-of-anchor tandem repeat GloVer-containing protein [Candidatus Sulfotelmatobacter sp.]
MQCAVKGKSLVAVLGTVMFVLGGMAMQAASAQSEAVLHSFSGSPDGAYVQSSALLPMGGSWYGVTEFGGTYDHGTIFKLTDSNGTWDESILYNFAGGSDGSYPIGALIADKAGNLYGVTNSGGAQNAGVVYELSYTDGSWEQAVLHNFGSGSDGTNPQGPLVFDSHGNLFGTTVTGGGLNGGTVYEMTLVNGVWNEKVLHSFGGTNDGYLAYGGLTLDAKGNVFGTTPVGGSNPCLGLGCGIVFELVAANGYSENTIHQFVGGADGINPNSKLAMDTSGNLYGSTLYGGGRGQCAAGIVTTTCGTIFELSPGSNGAWSEKILHRFGGGTGESEPNSPLILDRNGNLYGETAQTSSSNGTLFALLPRTGGGWALKLLFTFDGSNGANPQGGLRIGPGGVLYGTTIYGGANNYGVVFSLKP